MKPPFIAARKRIAGSAVGLGVCLALGACASRSQFQKGYDRGAADTVKRQYWILQNMQKGDAARDSDRRVTVYRLPVTPDPNATVKTVPYEISIPIYE